MVRKEEALKVSEGKQDSLKIGLFFLWAELDPIVSECG